VRYTKITSNPNHNQGQYFCSEISSTRMCGNMESFRNTYERAFRYYLPARNTRTFTNLPNAIAIDSIPETMTTTAPPKYIKNSVGKLILNPEYKAFMNTPKQNDDPVAVATAAPVVAAVVSPVVVDAVPVAVAAQPAVTSPPLTGKRERKRRQAGKSSFFIYYTLSLSHTFSHAPNSTKAPSFTGPSLIKLSYNNTNAIGVGVSLLTGWEAMPNLSLMCDAHETKWHYVQKWVYNAQEGTIALHSRPDLVITAPSDNPWVDSEGPFGNSLEALKVQVKKAGRDGTIPSRSQKWVYNKADKSICLACAPNVRIHYNSWTSMLGIKKATTATKYEQWDFPW